MLLDPWSNRVNLCIAASYWLLASSQTGAKSHPFSIYNAGLKACSSTKTVEQSGTAFLPDTVGQKL